MFCSSCGKKITENSKFCKYCGVNQVEIGINNKEDIKIPNEPFIKNILEKAWFYLWITTLLVFFVSLYIIVHYSGKNIDFFVSDYLGNLFYLNIIIGVIAFLAIIIVSFKKKIKPSFFTKKILIICLIYLLIIPSIFAIEGNKAINNEEYRKEHYVFTTPTPIPTIVVNLTPTVIPKKTVKPIQKAVDTDPTIDCVSSSPECKGSSIKLRKSQCSSITCCQIGSSWSVYPSSDKCKEAQNKNNNYSNLTPYPTRIIIPTSTYKAPTSKPAPTIIYVAPTSTYIAPTNKPAPTSSYNYQEELEKALNNCLRGCASDEYHCLEKTPEFCNIVFKPCTGNVTQCNYSAETCEKECRARWQ